MPLAAVDNDVQFQMKSDEVYKLLAASPLWEGLGVSEKDDAAREKIITNFSKIALYETPVIRAAVEKYLSQCFGGKNYDPKLGFSVNSISILNRFVFNVPEIIALEEFKKLPFYFKMPPPRNEAGVNLLWPVSLAKDGSLKLTGFLPTYVGPQPKPLSEFDIFNKAFGRRKAVGAVTESRDEKQAKHPKTSQTPEVEFC